MAIFGLVVRDDRKEIKELSKQALSWIESKKYQIIVEDVTSDLLKLNYKTLSDTELAVTADIILTLGGDGTLIGVARHAYGRSPIMLGVNFGTLGFLTEVSPHELIGVLDSFHEGDVRVSERVMLQTTVTRDGKEVFAAQAVNDAVIQNARDGLISIDILFKDEEVTRLTADGVIISTPTGSTAYSLAAGGSVVHPDLDCALITPICPHSLTSRPLVLPLDREIKVVIPENRATLSITIDGQVGISLKAGDTVCVTRSNNIVKFVRSPSRGYFKILQGKLNWGVPNSSD